MRGLLSRLREGLTASGTESRIRRGILLVVALAMTPNLTSRQLAAQISQGTVSLVENGVVGIVFGRVRADAGHAAGFRYLWHFPGSEIQRSKPK